MRQVSVYESGFSLWSFSKGFQSICWVPGGSVELGIQR